MQNKYIILPIILLFFCYLSAKEPLRTTQEWYSIGPNDKQVNLIVVDKLNRVLTVTKEDRFDELNIRFQDNWYKIPIDANMPINDVLEVYSGTIIVTVGFLGTNSDGIYMGRDILDGPPFYVFSLLQLFKNAQGIGVRGDEGDTLFIGAANSIYRSIKGNSNNYGDFEKIIAPMFCFGVESPFCAAIHFFTGDKLLYAGGYDTSPEPGQGHLIVQQGDEMGIIKDFNVTSITQGRFSDTHPLELVVGTLDTGIHIYNPVSSSNPWTHYSSPNNESVNQLITKQISRENDALYIAVNSGIYFWQNGTWQEVSDVPAEVYSIAVNPNNNEIYAGTYNGVYVHSETGIHQENLTNFFSLNNFLVSPSLGNISIRYTLPYSSYIKLEAFDIQGRLVEVIEDGFMQKGSYRITLDRKRFGSGVYFIKLKANGSEVSRKVTVVR